MNKLADAVIISGEYEFVVESLSKYYNGQIIKTKANPYLDKRVAFHPDMQFIDFGSDVFILKGSEYLIEIFKSLGKTIHITSQPNSQYPYDVLCNGKLIKNNFVCNKKTIFCGILEYAIKKEYNVIDVKQGYTGCSILAVNESTVITGDAGLDRILPSKGLISIFVDNRGITLPGYSNGFIGGSGGFYGDYYACLTGVLNSNEDMKQIENAFISNGVKLVTLTDEPMIDVGGIIPIYKNFEV